ncbi:hypothetical protein ACUWEX_00875 [Okibacterium fritillariae]|uniref:hypothetical protein n=1 Tax=Okibacterium fritillariae TaxID=123320 RepID=UPI0040556373
MTHRYKTTLGFAGLLVILSSVSGCTPQEPLAVFNQPKSGQDAVSGAIVEEAKIDDQSTRFIGVDGRGVSIFAAKTSSEPKEMCLLTVNVDGNSGWARGCGNELPISLTSEDGYTVTLTDLKKGLEAPEGAEIVGDYAYVQGPSS